MPPMDDLGEVDDDQPRKRKRRRDLDEDDDDRRPRKKKLRKRRASAGWTSWVPAFSLEDRAKGTYIGVFIALFLVAGFLAWSGVQEMILASRSSAKPEEISLADLLRRGRDGNPHVILKEFDLSDRIIVNKVTDIHGTRIKHAWLPIFPQVERKAGKVAADSRPVAVIRCNGDSQEEIERRCLQERIRGMVLLTNMGWADASELKKAYPDVHTGTLIVFELDKEPAGSGKWLAMLTGAVDCSLIALAMVVVWLVNVRRGSLD